MERTAKNESARRSCFGSFRLRPFSCEGGWHWSFPSSSWSFVVALLLVLIFASIVALLTYSASGMGSSPTSEFFRKGRLQAHTGVLQAVKIGNAQNDWNLAGSYQKRKSGTYKVLGTRRVSGRTYGGVIAAMRIAVSMGRSSLHFFLPQGPP